VKAVTGPNQIIYQGLVTKQHVKVTVTTPHRVIRIHGRVHRVHVRGKVPGKKIVVVIVRGCPRGLVHGGSGCGAPGKG